MRRARPALGTALGATLGLTFVTLAAAACRRTEPLASCRDSLAGIWRVEGEGGAPAHRWALIDRGTRLEGYPLFDDTEASPSRNSALDEAPRDATRGGVNDPAVPGQRGRERPLSIDDLVQSPRSLDLIRSHTSLLGHVERWVMRGGQKCQLRAKARVYNCSDSGGDSIEVQLGALLVPSDLAGCPPPPPADSSPPPQRWRRER